MSGMRDDVHPSFVAFQCEITPMRFCLGMKSGTRRQEDTTTGKQLRSHDLCLQL